MCINYQFWIILKNLFTSLNQSGVSMIIAESSKDVNPGRFRGISRMILCWFFTPLSRVDRFVFLQPYQSLVVPVVQLFNRSAFWGHIKMCKFGVFSSIDHWADRIVCAFYQSFLSQFRKDTLFDDLKKKTKLFGHILLILSTKLQFFDRSQFFRHYQVSQPAFFNFKKHSTLSTYNVNHFSVRSRACSCFSTFSNKALNFGTQIWYSK